MAADMAAVQKAQKAAKALSSKKSECVQVVVRSRPIFGKEVDEDRKVTQQKDMYDISASPIVDSVLEGFNGTIFAYGQTGAGKTHSMEGLMEPVSEQGIMPNAFKHIFDTISGNTDPTKQFLVRASYIEIYNEEIHDLLGKDVTQRKDLRDSTDRGVFVQDLTAQVVKSADEMNRVLKAGQKGRHTGATLMNKQSSRSHSIFTVTVETSEVGADGKPHIRVGKLNLVDLAGSERQSKTGATGQRLKEATKINLSLSALGNVIGALVDGKSKYIPYRDSKLTRLLQDSLGGNTKTMMVACVGPADYNFDESMGTLRYADRAKQIKNKPRINEDPKDAMLREFQEEIERLKAALAGQGGGAAGGVTTVMVNGQAMQVPTGGGQPQIIEKIVGISEEEAAILRGKHQRAQEEAREAGEARAKLAASAAKTEEERQALAAELERAAAVQRQQDEESARTTKQLAAMQEKLLQGGQIMDRAAKQEAELRQVKLEVEQRRKQEAALARELADRELELQDRYASVDEKLEDTTRKLRKAVAKYKEAKREIKDLTAEWQDEKAGMLDVARELDKERSLYLTLLKAFVPPAEVERLEARAVWDDAKDVWSIPYPQLAGARMSPRHPNVSAEDDPPSHRPVSEFARERAAFDDNPRYLVENILKFTLDEVDRTTEDYEGPDAHGRIPLMGEEEEEAAIGRGGGRAARPASARRGPSTGGGSSRRSRGAGGQPQESYPAARGLVRD